LIGGSCVLQAERYHRVAVHSVRGMKAVLSSSSIFSLI
jgi:hypothetical protein